MFEWMCTFCREAVDTDVLREVHFAVGGNCYGYFSGCAASVKRQLASVFGWKCIFGKDLIGMED